MRGDALMRYLLVPIEPALGRKGVREVVVDAPGRFRVEDGEGWHDFDAPEMDHDRLLALATLVAARIPRPLSAEHPACTGVLPGGQRITVARPPAVAPGIVSATIRCRAIEFTPTLEWLGERGYFRDVPAWPADRWRDIVEDGRSILVVGNIGSGKSTFAEAIIRAIPHDKRVVTVEGVPEWRNLPQASVLNLYFDGLRQTATDMVQLALRERPDAVPFGEVTGPEAWGLVRLGPLGHQTVTTAHARSCADGLKALALMARQSEEARSMERDDLDDAVRRAFRVVAHVDRNPFRVTEVMEL